MNKYKSDAATLETYRIALENSAANTTIATALAELGYDEAVLSEGKTLLNTARSAYEANKIEDDETSVAYNTFAAKKKSAGRTFP